MIGWIKGEVINLWRSGSREGIIISCEGIGYEIQVLKRSICNFIETEISVLWLHEQLKDDGRVLFGFVDRKEKEMFRKLIAINGVGPQIAMSLLESYSPNDIVKAIINSIPLRRL